MDPITILRELGATPAVILVGSMGFMFSLYVVIRIRAHSKLIAMQFQDNRDNRELYHRLDCLSYGTAKAFQAMHPHVKLVSDSADGAGNHTLDRSI